MTSTFLLALQLEWAFTILLTVALGYSFCPGAILKALCTKLSVVVLMIDKRTYERAFSVDFLYRAFSGESMVRNQSAGVMVSVG